MSDDQIQLSVNSQSEQPDQAERTPAGQRMQQSQASAPTQPRERVAPGRRPLFRS